MGAGVYTHTYTHTQTYIHCTLSLVAIDRSKDQSLDEKNNNNLINGALIHHSTAPSYHVSLPFFSFLFSSSTPLDS